MAEPVELGESLINLLVVVYLLEYLVEFVVDALAVCDWYKIVLLLCHSHIELRLWLKLS